jgi:predicted transcriptional regulator
MRTSDQFIDCYNRVDKHLNIVGGFDSATNFSQKVKALSIKDSTIRKFKDELLSYGELRNAIVHNPKIGDEPIAEPHIDTLSQLERIYKEITNPPKVIPKFQGEVLGAQGNDYINDILLEMEHKSFSQFPVFENGKVVELITTNTISRWLSKKLEKNGTIIIDEVKIKDLIPFIEFKLNYKFISRDTNVYEAYDYFVKHIYKDKRNLDVLFITNAGSNSGKLLGLITIEDIALYARL